jgi:hypothetical protein
MCLHAPAGGVVTPPPKYCNEEKTKQLLKRSSIRHAIGALFRFAGDLVEPILPESPQPIIPVSNDAQSNIDVMLACFSAGESWQDSLDTLDRDRD